MLATLLDIISLGKSWHRLPGLSDLCTLSDAALTSSLLHVFAWIPVGVACDFFAIRGVVN